MTDKSVSSLYNDKHRPEAMFRVRGEKVFWGLGLQELLIRTGETGSVKRAAAEMYMSYAKARRMIALAEDELGFDLLETRKGGTDGGGSSLTPKGRKYLEVCQRVQEDVQKFCEERFKEYMEE